MDVYHDWEQQDASFAKIRLEYAKTSKEITQEQYEALTEMLNSPDHKNFVLAEEILKIKDK